MVTYDLLLIVTTLTYLFNNGCATLADSDVGKNHSSLELTSSEPIAAQPTGDKYERIDEVNKGNGKIIEELNTTAAPPLNVTTGTVCIDEFRLIEIITQKINETLSSLRNREIQSLNSKAGDCGKDGFTDLSPTDDKLKDRKCNPGVTLLNNENDEKFVQLIKGEKGERGPPGPIRDVFDDTENGTTRISEVTTTKPESSRNLANSNQQSKIPGKSGDTEKIRSKDGNKGVKMVIVENKNFIHKISRKPIGTLVYITDEDAVLIRMKNNWRYLQLRSSLIVSSQAPVSHADKNPKYGPSLLLAALDEPYLGNLETEKANSYCQEAAVREKLKSNFKAFLSSSNKNIKTVVRKKYRDLPIRNLKGEILFNSWNEIFNGEGGNMPSHWRIISFDRRNVLHDNHWPVKAVWHGSTTDGNFTLLSCNSWTSQSVNMLGLATELSKEKLLGQRGFTCNNQLIVLCIAVTPYPSS